MAVRVTLTFPKGAVVRLEAEFTTEDGAPVDPTAVSVRTRTPAGVESVLVFGASPVLIRDGVGLFHADIAVGEVGTWAYRWEGTGTAQAVAEARFKVDAGAFA